MYYLLKNALRTLLIFGANLVACGGSVSIENGANLTNLSGKAGSQKLYSIKLPEGTVGLMAQVAGSTAISIEILDSNGNNMNACDPWLCVLTNPPAGNYKLRLSATADYSAVNLSASWGGPNVSVIKNDIYLEGLNGDSATVLLKSVYLSDFQSLASIEVSDPSARVEWLDAYGDVSYYCQGFSCVANSIEAGLYFVRVRASTSFANATLNVKWGDSLGRMLNNEETSRYSNVVKGSYLVVPFLVPDDVEKWAVATSNTDVRFLFLNENAQLLGANCGSVTAMICTPLGQPTGLIYALIEVTKNSPTLDLVLQFAGANYSSLESGLSSEPKPAKVEDIHVESFLIEAANTTLALHNTANAVTQIIDENNNQVCWSPCYLSNLLPGRYFTLTEVFSTHGSTHVNVSLAVGPPGQGTLTLENTLAGTVSFTGEKRNEIFFAEPGNAGYFLVVEGYAQAWIYDSNGNQLRSCGATYPCFVPAFTPGSYFVDMTLLGSPGDEYAIHLLPVE